MDDHVDRVLFSRDQIAQRLPALAAQILGDLHAMGVAPAAAPGSEALPPDAADAIVPGELTLVPIMTGGFIFAADLIRHLPLMMQIRLLTVSSYPGRSTTSHGAVAEAAIEQLPDSLEGMHVLVVDDILDSGNTLRLVSDLVRQRRPTSLKTCVLLRKERPEAMAFPVDYVAFDAPDEFVVGYGLDFDDYYRNLPDIVVLKRGITGA